MNMSLKGRDFLTLKDFTKEEIEEFLDLAAELKDKKKKGIFDRQYPGKIAEFFRYGNREIALRALHVPRKRNTSLKKALAETSAFFMVRETGLEPA